MDLAVYKFIFSVPIFIFLFNL